jgi:RNA recognition motif-containing protein
LFTVTNSHLYDIVLRQELSNIELYYSFVPFGTVISAKIMIDNSTGRSRGFGFVSFNHPVSAGNAIFRMNGVQMGNKRLKVQLKKEKPKGGKMAPAGYGSGRNQQGLGKGKGRGKGDFQLLTAARRRSRGRNRGRSTLDRQASERAVDAEVAVPDPRAADSESTAFRDGVEPHQFVESSVSEDFSALAIDDEGGAPVARETRDENV